MPGLPPLSGGFPRLLFEGGCGAKGWRFDATALPAARPALAHALAHLPPWTSRVVVSDESCTVSLGIGLTYPVRSRAGWGDGHEAFSAPASGVPLWAGVDRCIGHVSGTPTLPVDARLLTSTTSAASTRRPDPTNDCRRRWQ